MGAAASRHWYSTLQDVNIFDVQAYMFVALC